MFFFFNDTATTEIYTLSLHDALPISAWPTTSGSASSDPTSESAWRPASSPRSPSSCSTSPSASRRRDGRTTDWSTTPTRSEEHTSELQSRQYLVCRLLLEKKKKHTIL